MSALDNRHHNVLIKLDYTGTGTKALLSVVRVCFIYKL